MKVLSYKDKKTIIEIIVKSEDKKNKLRGF